VPIRAVCEKLGASVDWEASTQTATVTYNGTVLLLTIGSREMKVNENSVWLDIPPAVYNGRTLLPIRAVVENLGCDVRWDGENSRVIIDNINSVKIDGLQSTGGNAGNWARVSSVQQFLYKDEGIAYGYVSGGKLNINLPNEQLILDLLYPKLGDIISDDGGNIYIVWGRDNESDDTTVETVMISKYTGAGQLIKTTGFTGESKMGNDGNTQKPFEFGDCEAAVQNGWLMVNYSRGMYNGHQSDNVIGVKTEDMSPVKYADVWDIPYTSHSFNQSVVWSDHANEFVFAGHGDAYDRGFCITVGSKAYLPFHFYLEANADYNMSIVNKTFAQLGGIGETTKGIVLVGASAKSISEAAKEEKQNLFVQIFNPNAVELNEAVFTGGVERSGATSFDINDNSNKPLTPVTDYGVRWLTDYTDTDVIAPQMVSTSGNIIILWAADNDTFYMVLDESGEVVKPATSLMGLPLNAYERPLFYNGCLYWAAVSDSQFAPNRVGVCKLDLSGLSITQEQISADSYGIGFMKGYYAGKSAAGKNVSFDEEAMMKDLKYFGKNIYAEYLILGYKHGWEGGYGGELNEKTEETPPPSPTNTRRTPTLEEIWDPTYIYTHYSPEYRYEWTYVTGYQIGYNHGEVTGNGNGSYDDATNNGYVNADERAGYEDGYKRGYADGYKVGYESDYARMKRLEK
jgi:hypothetical protein